LLVTIRLPPGRAGSLNLLGSVGEV
jgi:hypothetical protein